MSAVKVAAFDLPEDKKNKPACKNCCFRRTVKYSYMIGSLSILVSAALFTTYLFAYPFRSNVCNGLVGSGTLSGDKDETGIAGRCVDQVTARGYKSTTELVNGGLLPAGWAKKTTTGGVDRYDLCTYNTVTEACEEAEPDATACFSDKDDKGRRKNRWGNDGNCEALKAPEICRQTGFLEANTADAQKDLAVQGAAAEAAAVVLLVTTVLAVLQTLNYHWLVFTACCPKSSHKLCGTFGRPCGLNIGYLFCGNCMKCHVCHFCAKGNLPDDNINDESPGFTVPYEAATIFLSFFVHNVLITVFGYYGKIARDTVEDKCFNVKNVAGCKPTPNLAAGEKLCVYGTDQTAASFIDANTADDNTGDARRHMQTRGNVYDVALVFWWINTICFGIQFISYFVSNRNSADMELVAIRSTDDLNPFADISANDDNTIGSASTKGYKPVKQHTRVQLRGNF